MYISFVLETFKYKYFLSHQFTKFSICLWYISSSSLLIFPTSSVSCANFTTGHDSSVILQSAWQCFIITGNPTKLLLTSAHDYCIATFFLFFLNLARSTVVFLSEHLLIMGLFEGEEILTYPIKTRLIQQTVCTGRRKQVYSAKHIYIYGQTDESIACPVSATTRGTRQKIGEI